MALIPLVGGILLLIMLLGDSEGDNAWGPCAYTLQTGGRPVYHTGQYNPNGFYNGAQQNTYDPNSFYGGQNQNNQYQSLEKSPETMKKTLQIISPPKSQFLPTRLTDSVTVQAEE